MPRFFHSILVLCLVSANVFGHLVPSSWGIRIRQRGDILHSGTKSDCGSYVLGFLEGDEADSSLVDLLRGRSFCELSAKDMATAMLLQARVAVSPRQVERGLPKYLAGQTQSMPLEVSAMRIYFLHSTVWGLELTAAEWLQNAKRLFNNYPNLKHVRLKGFETPLEVGAALANPILAKLESLELDLDTLKRNFPGEEREQVRAMNVELFRTVGLKPVFPLKQLKSLNLRKSFLDFTLSNILLSSCKPGGLEELDLSSTLTDRSAFFGQQRTYVWDLHTRLFSGLKRFRISGINARDLKSLLSYFSAARLISLDISNATNLGDEGMWEMKSSLELAGLKELNLRHIGMSADGITALRRLVALPNLRRLDLSFNDLGESGIKEMDKMDLASLKSLNLSRTGIDDDAMTQLASLTSLSHVAALNLSRNPFGDISFVKLVAARTLPKTTILDLSDTGLRGGGYQSLLQSWNNFTKLSLLTAGTEKPQAVAPRWKVSVEEGCKNNETLLIWKPVLSVE